MTKRPVRKWGRIYLDRWSFLHILIVVLGWYFLMVKEDQRRFFIILTLQWVTILVMYFTREDGSRG